MNVGQQGVCVCRLGQQQVSIFPFPFLLLPWNTHEWSLLLFRGLGGGIKRHFCWKNSVFSIHQSLQSWQRHTPFKIQPRWIFFCPFCLFFLGVFSTLDPRSVVSFVRIGEGGGEGKFEAGWRMTNWNRGSERRKRREEVGDRALGSLIFLKKKGGGWCEIGKTWTKSSLANFVCTAIIWNKTTAKLFWRWMPYCMHWIQHGWRPGSLIPPPKLESVSLRLSTTPVFPHWLFFQHFLFLLWLNKERDVLIRA